MSDVGKRNRVETFRDASSIPCSIKMISVLLVSYSVSELIVVFPSEAHSDRASIDIPCSTGRHNAYEFQYLPGIRPLLSKSWPSDCNEIRSLQCIKTSSEQVLVERLQRDPSLQCIKTSRALVC